ncbi:MAG: family 78 glycoside hydrolase catalytic domain [Terracidiphilus sp.]|nr:family 78 glycoside hydrolase catalytic domain [Terracidiphilus sp.]
MGSKDIAAAVICGLLTFTASAQGPVKLQVDNLTSPLGIDDPTPSFSWQLDDSTHAARQTAYQIQVAKSEAALRLGHADVWDSGRIPGAKSINLRYAGPKLNPSTRYWWRVTVWGADGREYVPSQPSWWETGLLQASGWKASWIGYETTEEAAVRHAPAEWIASPESATLPKANGEAQKYAFRVPVTLSKPVKHASLYAAGQDTVSAWINGKKALDAQPFPPYKQMPWKKFVRADVTESLVQGVNMIAVEQVSYARSAYEPANTLPMVATLFVEFADGTSQTFASDTSWKSSAKPGSGWQEKSFNDSDWVSAAVSKELPGPTSSPLGHPWLPDSVKALRHGFAVAKPVKSARLYATALGAYNLFLNGKPVSSDVLAPGWTDYREKVFYQTYDVTQLLTQGKNAIGALLAPGWYSTPLEWFQQPNNYGVTPPALRAQLRIEYEDGSVEWVSTGPEWQAQRSEILSSEIYDGETQDARRAEPGWTTVRFGAGNWPRATAIEPAAIEVVAQDFEPIHVEREVQAVSVSEPKPGVYVYDFGQNLAGLERLRVSGTSGTDVQVRFAEILNDDGTIYTDNLRTAKATDHFILAGKGVEEFTPRFTFHGYRYAEVTGLKAAPGKDALTALVIHTAAPFAAELNTGSAMLNKLWSNIQWGQRSNFVGVPTDCPQRDERLGWAADAQVFWRAAAYNMDLAAFSRKFAADLRGTQAGSPFYGIYAPGTASPHSSGTGAGWSDAGVVIPWTSWLQTGDTRVIDENWAAMEKYLAAIDAANPDGLWKNQSGIPFGDWLSPEGVTQYGLVASAYWAYDAELMRQMAHATGRTADEQKYVAIFEKVRAAFQKAFVHDDGFVAGADNSPNPFGSINTPDTKIKSADTQTGYVLALHMNLVPENLRGASVDKLIGKIEANHGLLGTGFLGTPYLLEELTKTGHTKEAFTLLLNTKYPSWGYLVEHGATTMWERWNGDQMKNDPGMNSYNHYAYGAVGDWIARYAAGVDTTPLDAGFHTVVLQPHFDARLGTLDFKYDSTYGPIHSAWTVKETTAEWEITLPANTTGWLALDDMASSQWSLGGVPLAESKLATHTTRDGKPGYELAAGNYAFKVTLP